MAKRLIVNADDFGLTPGINRAVAELHDAGALTSATLMASGQAFDDAVRLAKQRPALGIGCHVVLTDGVPVSRLCTIPSLLGHNRESFRHKLHHFLAAALTHQIDPDEVEREAVAQIRRIQAAGLTVTHLDTHKHTHLLPFILKPLLRAALHTGVPAIRNPFEKPWSSSRSTSASTRTLQLRLVQTLEGAFQKQAPICSGLVQTTSGTIGVSATGNLDRPTLQSLLEAMPDGTWELVCHPGYNDSDLEQVATRLRASREVERRALFTLLAADSSHPSRPELIHYGSLTRAES